MHAVFTMSTFSPCTVDSNQVAGIVAGLIIGAVVLVIIIIAIVCIRRKQSKKPKGQSVHYRTLIAQNTLTI